MRAACLLPLALAIVGGAGWLATTARAQGDQVLTFQMSLGVPNPAGDGGVPGIADGQFVFPKGIAIDSTGRFIVADTESYEGVVESSNRIQIFGPDGTLERVFGGTGDLEGQFWYPTGVAVDATDRIIVTDNDNYRIQIFSPANTRDVNDVDGDLDTNEVIGPQFLAQFGAFGNFDPLSGPDVWDLDGDGDVTETDPTYEPYDPGTAPLDRFYWPSGVGVKPGTRLLDPSDSAGRVAIVDNGNHRIVVLNSMLQPILQFGGHTSNDNPSGTFEYPWGVAIDNLGQFFVSDTNNHRVQVFDANGGFLWTFGANTTGGTPAPGDLSSPSGIAIDFQGRLLVADTDRSRVLRIDLADDLGSGSLLPACSDVSASQVHKQCQVSASNLAHYAALVLGGADSGVERFRFAQGVATDFLMGPNATGRVAVADTDFHIVRVFQPAQIEIVSAVAAAATGVAVGDPVTLTVVVQNLGGSTLTVNLDVTASLAGTLTDTLPQEIPPTEQRTFDLTFEPDQPGELTFTVEAEGLHVSGARVHATPKDASPTITVASAARPSLLVTIGVDRTYVGIDETITVSVTLANTGNTTFSSIWPVVTFSPATEPAIVTLHPDHSPPEEPFGGPLEPGSSRPLEYVYKAASEGSVSFTVTATAKYEDDTYVYPVPPGAPLTATSETVRVSNDTVPPVTVPTFPDPDGDNLWYVEPFTLRLTASDAAGDVQSIFYRVEALDSYTATTTASTVDIQVESEGQTAVTFYAIDAAGNIEASRTMVFHLDTVPPTAGQVVVSPAASPNGWHNSDVVVQVVGGDYTSGVASASSETVTDEGIHQVLLTVTDFAGNVSTTQATVKIDKTPPVVSCSTLTMGTVWPPNHKLVPWVTSVDVTDVGDIDKQSGAAGFVLVSATSSEPDNGRGDGNTTADIQGFVIGTPDTEGFIRAERSGKGHGRVYSLVYEGRDGAGNVAQCTVLTRLVPHDARDHDDDGADDDSDQKDTKNKKDTKKATDGDKGKKKS